ncbi:MAG: amidase family protein, partial [Pseudomonadota bacterium]|nr:amidase family protein [Pseudomonadota bacterium]
MTEPCDLSAVEARRLIGRKRLSPIELVESCIARIEMVNPTVNAVVAECYDRARAEARAATEALVGGAELPPLHGLPFGVKDLNDTEGLVTTYGSTLYRDNVPEKDELLVGKLRQAGGIVLGKTATPEFGAGGNTTVNEVHGYTRNAFDPSRACGGSSGGSGVALACGMMPLCTGSDSGGSLRKPATFSGVSAIRPTTGLVPSDKRGVGFTNFSVQGPMARTADDCALMLSVMAGDDVEDPLSFNVRREDYRLLPEVDLSTLRVAI